MDKKCGNPGDSEIIKRVINGDTNAFELLVTRYKSHVFALVSRRIPAGEAEQVAHDIFVRAYTGLSGYGGKSGFKSWLAGITIRACRDFWRRAYRNREIAESSLSDAQLKWIETALAGASMQARDREDRNIEVRKITDHLLGRLSPDDRVVMELVYLEGHSHKEAAVILGSTVTAVRVRAFRARKKLRLYLEKKGLGNENSGP